eukprot:1195191-Prorocentrum_minimum.AAC.3
MKPKPNTTLVEYLTSWSRGPPGTAGAHRGRLTDRPVREGRIIIFVRKTLTAGFRIDVDRFRTCFPSSPSSPSSGKLTLLPLTP